MYFLIQRHVLVKLVLGYTAEICLFPFNQSSWGSSNLAVGVHIAERTIRFVLGGEYTGGRIGEGLLIDGDEVNVRFSLN